jgi:hypothetical protein
LPGEGREHRTERACRKSVQKAAWDRRREKKPERGGNFESVENQVQKIKRSTSGNKKINVGK